MDRGVGTIPLCVGNPGGEQPASFTRFVLPFVCTLGRDQRAGETDQFYDDVPVPRIVARSRYFTPETADVLFRRARWLELKGQRGEVSRGPNPGGKEPPAPFRTFRLPIGKDEIEIALAPPRMVLFEADAQPHVELTATGFLLVDVYFPSVFQNDQTQTPTLDDLLLVNELFRYWRQPFDKHPGKECTTARGVTRFGTVLQATSAALEGVGYRGKDQADAYFDRWDWLLSYPIKAADDAGEYLRITSTAREAARNWARAKDTEGSINAPGDETGWIAYTDERAFVWTCAITKNGANDLTDAWQVDPSQTGMWLRLLNVDQPSTEWPTPFEKEWLQGRTYERWKHVGTLYGFNTHSGAMLDSPCPEPPVWRHFSETYFDQVLLLLYLRVSTFRFSRELARISADLPSPKKRDYREFRRIRRVFAFFTNLYRFPLISSQQQGIEMYAFARKGLDVDALFEEVQAEIGQTHEMFELTTTSQMSAAIAWLTFFAFVVGSFGGAMAFLAADAIKPYDPPRADLLGILNHLPLLAPAWWLIVISLGGSTLAAIALWRWLRR